GGAILGSRETRQGSPAPCDPRSSMRGCGIRTGKEMARISDGRARSKYGGDGRRRSGAARPGGDVVSATPEPPPGVAFTPSQYDYGQVTPGAPDNAPPAP